MQPEFFNGTFQYFCRSYSERDAAELLQTCLAAFADRDRSHSTRTVALDMIDALLAEMLNFDAGLKQDGSVQQ